MSELRSKSFTQTIAGITDFFGRLNTNPRVLMVVAAAAVISVAIALLLWARSPDYRVLYQRLDDRDGGAIIQQLKQMHISYKITANGSAIMVPAANVLETRMQLAQKGLPKRGTIGYELLDKEKFGISQFSEQIDYQRALEGELARTIETLDTVQSASVHLALPRPSLFIRQQQHPSASITLILRSGTVLSSEQVQAISYMVSRAVPGLSTDNISIIDQDGNLLTSADTPNQTLSTSRLKYADTIEADYQRRIAAILSPIVGGQNVKVQVTAQIDYSNHEQTAESYQPNTAVDKMSIRSHQLDKSEEFGQKKNGGVPGALSNQPIEPPGQAYIEDQNQVNNTKQQSSNSSSSSKDKLVPLNQHSQEITNYELNQTIQHTIQKAGEITRLSVAVAVNPPKDSQGKPVHFSSQQINQMENLVRATMGYSQARGDDLSLVVTNFTPTAAQDESLPFWKQPFFIGLILSGLRYLFAAIIILLLWRKVLKPLLKKQQEILQQQRLAKVEEMRQKHEEEVSNEARQQQINEDIRIKSEIAKQRLHDLARQDPRLIASVIRQWFNTNEDQEQEEL